VLVERRILWGEVVLEAGREETSTVDEFAVAVRELCGSLIPVSPGPLCDPIARVCQLHVLILALFGSDRIHSHWL